MDAKSDFVCNALHKSVNNEAFFIAFNYWISSLLAFFSTRLLYMRLSTPLMTLKFQFFNINCDKVLPLKTHCASIQWH